MSKPAVHQPSVFVVDDDRQLLDSLVELLDVLGFQVLAFSSPGAFMKFYRAEMSGCLILDIRMPRQNGLNLYEQLLREGKKIPVIFITAHADVSMAVAAMKTGATEFLEKPFDRSTLLDRIRKALALDAEWRREEAEFAAIVDRIDQLSERERETLELITAGESNKSMASKLFVGERAIEMRRASIMRKLQVESVAELLNLISSHRILTKQREKTFEMRSR
jgi:FixJ family two-component response regulator